MATVLQLDELIDHLPDPHELGFQAWISNQVEYLDLTTYGNEIPSGKRAEFMKHQKFIRRLMTFNDDIMLLWDTGSGKTLGMTSVSEYYREHPGEIKHVYILVSSDTQVEEFSRQIVCKSSDGYYENEASKYARTEQGQKRNINKRLKTWYTITTHIRFSNMISEMYPTAADNERLARDFSGCIFLVDEVQGLRLSEEEAKEERQRGQVYTNIWRVFHLMKGGKRIIASATPMTERVQEFGPIINLIQSLDKQFYDPFLLEVIKNTGIMLTANPIEVDWETVTAEEIIPKIESKISFITSSQTGASIDFKGKPVDFTYQFPRDYYDGVILDQDTVGIKSKLVLDPCYMLEHQTKGYLKSVGSNEQNAFTFTTSTENDGSAWQHGPRQALCWVFPDGSYGKEGFEKYVQKSGNNYIPNQELTAWMANEQYLQQMSIKASRIIKGATTEVGKRYVYSRYVNGGGAIMLGLALEQYSPEHSSFKGMKYKKFSEARSVFISTSTIGRIRPYCSKENSKYEYSDDDAPSLLKLATAKSDRIIRPNFTKAPRYALITKSTPDSEKAAIFELYNSPENTLGEYIQVIIVSPVGQIGINLFDVLHVDIFTPEWVPNLIYQSRNRAFRVVSHVNILKYLRKKYGSQYQLKVPVHYYACYKRGMDGLYHDTLDSNMYKKSEYKDIKIKRVFRVFKRCAVDCYINLHANTRYTEQGSPECDYMDCKYECVDKREDVIRSNTYKAFFRDDIVKKYKSFLMEYWQINTSASISQLIKYYYEHHERLPSEYNEVDLQKYLIFTLEDMITNRNIVHDRFGMPSYIENTGNTYYLSHRHPDIQTKKLSTVITSGIYTKTLTAISQTKLKDISMEYETQISMNIIKYIYETDITEGLDSYIRGLKPEGKVRLLEDAVIRHVIPESNVNPAVSVERLEFILKMFKNSVMVTNEPLETIKKTAATIGEVMRQKNIRQITMDNMPKINIDTLEVKIDLDADKVFIHNIYVIGQNVHGRKVMSKYYKVDGRLRLFNPKKGSWRDLTLYEAPVYSRIFQLHLESKRKEFNSKHEVYGKIISTTKEFRIVDNRGNVGTRSVGKIAIKMGKYELIDVMYFIGHKNPFQVNIFDRKMLENEILRKYHIKTDDTWSNDRLNFFYYWSRHERKIDELSARIALHMYYSSKGSMIDSDTEEDSKGLIWEYVKSMGYEDLISDYDETVPKTPLPEDVINFSDIQTPNFIALSLETERREEELRRLKSKHRYIEPEYSYTDERKISEIIGNIRKETSTPSFTPSPFPTSMSGFPIPSPFPTSTIGAINLSLPSNVINISLPTNVINIETPTFSFISTPTPTPTPTPWSIPTSISNLPNPQTSASTFPGSISINLRPNVVNIPLSEVKFPGQKP